MELMDTVSPLATIFLLNEIDKLEFLLFIFTSSKKLSHLYHDGITFLAKFLGLGVSEHPNLTSNLLKYNFSQLKSTQFK